MESVKKRRRTHGEGVEHGNRLSTQVACQSDPLRARGRGKKGGEEREEEAVRGMSRRRSGEVGDMAVDRGRDRQGEGVAREEEMKASDTNGRRGRECVCVRVCAFA
jgi:hypothetical protein